MPNFFKKALDPISCYTHFLGALGFVIGGILLISRSITHNNDILTTISVIVFTVSLFALYNASWIYHFQALESKYKLFLRKMDHSMIYVLIAGTYTPIAIAVYPENTRLIFLGVIWSIALAGIIIKLCCFNAPRWLGTGFYLFMGWALIFYIKPILTMSAAQLSFLIAGGIFYSVGAVFYALKKPNISQQFGFHELFHICVLLGTLSHFLLVWIYLI